MTYGFRQSFITPQRGILSKPDAYWRFDLVEIDWESNHFSTIPAGTSGGFGLDLRSGGLKGICNDDHPNLVFKDRIFPI
jgi:hypothetical protein